MSERTVEELHRNKYTPEKGREIHLRVNKVAFSGPKAWDMRVFTLFTPFKFTRKSDSWDGKVKEGEEDWGKSYEFPVKQLGPFVELLLDVDRRFNEGRVAEDLKFKFAAAKTTSLADDDVPF